MYGQLLGLLLLASQIIFNESSSIEDSSESVSVEYVAPLATRPTAGPDGYVPFPDVQASYKLYEEPVETWFAARDRCIADNARLIVANTVQKIQHVNSLKTNLSANKWVHTGIYRVHNTNKWVRVDNDQELTDIPWIEGNPDGTGDCAGISVELDGLVDYKCDWSDEIFCCEKFTGVNY